LPKQNEAVSLRLITFHLLLLIVALILTGMPVASAAQSRDNSPSYSRLNTMGVFGAFSGDSSHILLGQAENRRLLSLGVAYSRRLAMNHEVSWQYDAEVVPVAMESDPLGLVVEQQTSPNTATYSYNSGPLTYCSPINTPYSETDPVTGTTYSGTVTISCHGRRWVAGEAISPAGLRWNFLPQHKTQFFVGAHGGYMYSTQEIPVNGGGSFNFTFDVGAGIEYYRSRNRSIRVEYRYHHISNNDSAQLNPGIDNGLIQVMYCFGFGRQ